MYAPYVEPAIRILIFYINNYFLILKSNSATLLPRLLAISAPNSLVSSFPKNSFDFVKNVLLNV